MGYVVHVQVREAADDVLRRLRRSRLGEQATLIRRELARGFVPRHQLATLDEIKYLPQGGRQDSAGVEGCHRPPTWRSGNSARTLEAASKRTMNIIDSS